MVDPYEHYQMHQGVYDQLWDRTLAARHVFERSDKDTQCDMLDQAIRFALLSAQTQVPQQEAGYLRSLDVGKCTEIRARLNDPTAPQLSADQVSPPTTFPADRLQSEYGCERYERALAVWDELADELKDAGVNYSNNKAAYIVRNAVEPDYGSILSHWMENAFDAAHQQIVDDFLGVSLSKAAYAMGKLGCSEKLCIDTHVATVADIPSDKLYQGTVVDRFEKDCAKVEAAFPKLATLPRPLFRWILFDAHRFTTEGGPAVTTHDVLFESFSIDSVG